MIKQKRQKLMNMDNSVVIASVKGVRKGGGDYRGYKGDGLGLHLS